jgi:cation transport protein ChaC
MIRDGRQFRPGRRGSLGVWLWLANLAARLRLPRTGASEHSFDHRGTPERPGLVLGLDFGGACRGIAYRVAAKQRAATLAYLRGREQTTAVYRELLRGVWLEGQPDRRVEALCYAVDRGHPQYAGRLSHDRQLHIVRQGRGRSGNNRDYVIETARALEELNITDHDLHVVAERLKGSPDARA